jgi:hypothetical protein
MLLSGLVIGAAIYLLFFVGLTIQEFLSDGNGKHRG